MSDELDRSSGPGGPGIPDHASDGEWHYTRFDWSEVPAIVGIAEAIAETTDCDATDLQPIYEAVDPDALDALVEAEEPQELTITFAVDSVQVAVSGDGTVGVRPTG